MTPLTKMKKQAQVLMSQWNIFRDWRAKIWQIWRLNFDMIQFWFLFENVKFCFICSQNKAKARKHLIEKWSWVESDQIFVDYDFE